MGEKESALAAFTVWCISRTYNVHLQGMIKYIKNEHIKVLFCIFVNDKNSDMWLTLFCEVILALRIRWMDQGYL